MNTNKTKLNIAFAIAYAGMLMLAVPARASVITLTAVDSESMGPISGFNFTDNRIRAFRDTSVEPANGTYDGLIKFDLSAIPDVSTINSMTLTTYVEGAFGSPHNNPTVYIYRSSGDSWSRSSGSDAYPGLNELVSGPQSGTGLGDLDPITWSINVSAFDYSADLSDNVLTFVMRNSSSSTSWLYTYGSDASPAPPQLEINYTVPEPTTGILLTLGTAALALKRRRPSAK